MLIFGWKANLNKDLGFKSAFVVGESDGKYDFPFNVMYFFAVAVPILLGFFVGQLV